MLDLEGPQLTAQERQLLSSPAVGGVILFARNIVDRTQVAQLNQSIRDVNPSLLLAVDQEGGRVARLRQGYTPLPAMQRLGEWYLRDQAGAAAAARELGWLMAVEVLASGFDLSFAPVLDVDRDYCSVIGDRAFSDTPAAVVELAGAFIAGMSDAGMAATGKHFPGHGGVVGDSHLELPVDRRDWQQLLCSDLLPFRALAPQLAAVMPAHILFPAVDADHPVGFSPHWLGDKLRGQLGFAGVIFSDDLSMQGAAGIGSYCQRAAAALQAGCDMVLVCNHRQGALEVIDWLQRQPQRCGQRLAAMRRRQRPQWPELLASQRWQQAQQLSLGLLAG